MSQVKKPAVEEAILAAADGLFRESGYAGTTMSAIARNSRVSTANIYSYFGSKLHLMFAVYAPWLSAQLDQMEIAVRREIEPAARVETLLRWMWYEIPARDNYFSNNLLQAVSTAHPDDHYSDSFLGICQSRVAALLQEIGIGEREASHIAFTLWMAFDGFSVKTRIESSPPPSGIIQAMTTGILALLPSDQATT